VSIADAYDAMIQDRPYKRAIGHDEAIHELHRHAGTQFDPELVEVFVRLFGNRAPIADQGLLTRPLPTRLRTRVPAKRATA
jgi:HD-GYP domain-containing protein (c-di-GMP phosphodiesterase class II)